MCFVFLSAHSCVDQECSQTFSKNLLHETLCQSYALLNLVQIELRIITMSSLYFPHKKKN